MNETRQIAFNAAMELTRLGKLARDVVYEARDIEQYLTCSDRWVESGADAETTAARTFQDGMPDGKVVAIHGDKIITAITEPSPSANGEVTAQAPGADAPATAADGRSAREADKPVAKPKSAKSKKPRKEKKAKREKKAKASDPAETSVAEAIKDEVPHTEPAVKEELPMEAAA